MKTPISKPSAVAVAGLLLNGLAFAGSSVESTDPPAAEPAADATLFPIPDYPGSLWERSALLGDWGGVRTALAERGIQVELALTSIYQGVADGGREDDSWEFSHSADYRLKLDFEKLGLWKGGFLQVNAESRFGEHVNGRTGVLLPVNNDALYPLDGDDGTAVPSIVFGLFGNAFFCVTLGMGFSILSGGLTLACMVLPLLIRTTEESLRAVPRETRLAAAALGFGKTATIFRLILPMAVPGLVVGLILGVGRALAETAALKESTFEPWKSPDEAPIIRIEGVTKRFVTLI